MWKKNPWQERGGTKGVTRTEDAIEERGEKEDIITNNLT